MLRFCSDRIRNSGNIRGRRFSTSGALGYCQLVVAAAIEAMFEIEARRFSIGKVNGFREPAMILAP
jgi:hypothetical protein